MEDTFLIFFVGIVFAMFIAAINSGRRRPNSHINHDSTNMSDFVYFGSDDTHHSHHHGHADHGSSSDFSHGDSGSCHSGSCDGGSGGCD